MYKVIFSLTLCLFLFVNLNYNQTPKPIPGNNPPLRAEESLEFISADLEKISRSVEELNKSIVKTYKGLLSSNGLVLTENQQKLLVSFEILNRAEKRLSNLQTMRIELMEKQTTIRGRIAGFEDSLQRENIDRSVALRGTTNAEKFRERRRRILNNQKSGLERLLNEIQSTLGRTNTEFIETQQLVQELRRRLFPAIYRELPKLDTFNK